MVSFSLLGLQHPEPNGSRRATPTSTFQHRPGHLRATWRSIGPIGLTLAAALFGALIWVLLDTGILDLNEPKAITWALLIVFATILAIGLSWSHVRRRLSGQADMDDVDD